MEGEGSSEMEFTIIKTPADSLHTSVIFHVVIDILGFILFMHQQIPAILQVISNEFEELRVEYNDLVNETPQSEAKAASLRKKQATRKREVRMGIRKLEKLMNSITNIKSAVQSMITEIPNLETIILVLGPSPQRPLHVYELCFSLGRVVSMDFGRSKVAEGFSRKAIRTLISRGAGSDSYAGPTKLFLLIKAPSSFNLPLHFHPKREFRYNKKTVPFKLRFERSRNQEMVAEPNNYQTTTSDGVLNSPSTELIWFQCRHVIKGMSFRASPVED